MKKGTKNSKTFQVFLQISTNIFRW
jgi:hypothetical protein